SEFIKTGASLSDVVKTLQASRVRDANLNPRGPGARQPGSAASAQEVAAGWEASAAKTNKMLGLVVAR
ncbi:hypothetical protein, partial [Mesorhizobium sp. M2A.F.Ca.ET.067.02.1.1]|uniref:hypothetical protein n=1 Tax=Mesorhizobium sp. M2A.F.Ca.ET.067.02.1.1 TaxID=2496749 RepID=UPI00167AD0E0